MGKSKKQSSRLNDACERGIERLEKWKLDEDPPVEKPLDPFSRRQVLLVEIKHQLEKLSL